MPVVKLAREVESRFSVRGEEVVVRKGRWWRRGVMAYSRIPGRGRWRRRVRARIRWRRRERAREGRTEEGEGEDSGVDAGLECCWDGRNIPVYSY